MIGVVILYAVAGVTGWVPWHGTPGATVASGVWLVLAGIVLILGTRRIQAAKFATSRRNAYRAPVRVPVSMNGIDGALVDISVGGAAVRFPRGSFPGVHSVALLLPGAEPISLQILRVAHSSAASDIASLRVAPGDWTAYRELALWLFHTPPGIVDGLPPNAPAVAAISSVRGPRRSVLARQHG
jgi:cellulose synthase (UDP-forming)